MAFNFPLTATFCSVPNAVRNTSFCQSVLDVPSTAVAGTPVTVGTNALNSSAVSTSNCLVFVLTEKFPL